MAPLATGVDGGRLLIGGSHDLGDDSPEVRPDVVAAIRAYLETFVAPVRLAPTRNAWCCFRPTHPDYLPVIDRVPGLDNAWITSGHYRTGIVMAPATADVLADWIATDRQPPGVARFSATRFGPVP